jgi:hypothetical protein
MYNGSGWTVVGPSYKATDGKSGSLVEDVIDSNGTSHTVIKFYSNNNVSAIVSYDSTFTPRVDYAITGFTVINPGITLSTEANNLLYGTATNAQQLGNIAAVNYARNDIDSAFYGNISVQGGNAAVTSNPGTGTLRLINTANNGNISLFANVSGVSTRMLHVNTSTGEVTVSANATSTMGLTTKSYVDSQIQINTAPLAPLYSPVFTGVPLTPTASSGTNTTQIASTAFVQTTVATATSALWLGSSKTVSTNAPTNGVGNPGDFWFQI